MMSKRLDILVLILLLLACLLQQDLFTSWQFYLGLKILKPSNDTFLLIALIPESSCKYM